MTVLVGLAPQARDDAAGAVTLAARLAAAWDEDVAVIVVVPPGVDDGGGAGGERVSGGARAAAEAVLASAGRSATWRTVPGRSPADALLDAATAPGVSAIVLGASGRVAARVARASPVAVGLARPGGGPASPVTRVTCAYAGTPGSEEVLGAAAAIARRSGAALRVASFAVRRPPGYPPEAGLDAEDAVVAGWAEQTAAAQRDALARLGVEAEPGVWSGDSWEDAVRAPGWHGGDLIVLGRSPGPAARLLLGDRVRAILAAAPVPALVV